VQFGHTVDNTMLMTPNTPSFAEAARAASLAHTYVPAVGQRRTDEHLALAERSAT
jgi:hypothetical protein